MRWPLRTDSFTWKDRLKLAAFLLNPRKRWTQDKEVRIYEELMAEFIGAPTLFVSSGSTANTLLAMYRKETCGERDLVIFPAVTWPTSCSPWIHLGFKPRFIDITRTDFSVDIDALRQCLKDCHKQVACVFLTSVLGFVPDMEGLRHISNQFKVPVWMDNCESALSQFGGRNISSLFTSTISTYFSHHLQSVEGGFIISKDQDLMKWCTMARNHGMVRSLPRDQREPYENTAVDSRFDFYCLGNNFRNTDINAYIGQLDFKRVDDYIEQRLHTMDVFREAVDPLKYYIPAERPDAVDVPFALPILRNNDWESHRKEIIKLLNSADIENRPIISGNLLKHTAFKQYLSDNYPTADVLHSGLYVGIGPGIKDEWVEELSDLLNAIP